MAVLANQFVGQATSKVDGPGTGGPVEVLLLDLLQIHRLAVAQPTQHTLAVQAAELLDKVLVKLLTDFLSAVEAPTSPNWSLANL